MFVQTGSHICKAFWDSVQKATRNRRTEKRKNFKKICLVSDKNIRLYLTSKHVALIYTEDHKMR